MGWVDPILSFCRKSEKFGTVSGKHLDLFEVVPSAGRVVDALLRRRPRPPSSGLLART
jgi:hypothetical protein